MGDDHPVLPDRRAAARYPRRSHAWGARQQVAAVVGPIVTCTRGRWPKRATIDTALVARARAATLSFVVVGPLAAITCSMPRAPDAAARGRAEWRQIGTAIGAAVPQAVVLRQGMVAPERGVTFRPLRRDQRMQGFDIGWKRIGALAHTREESDSHPAVTHKLCRLIQLVTALTTSPSDAGRHGHEAATSPSRRRAPPAAMRSVA